MNNMDNTMGDKLVVTEFKQHDMNIQKEPSANKPEAGAARGRN